MILTDFARVYGAAFLLIGRSGFVPGLSPAHAHPGLAVEAGSAMAAGLFPVNILHDFAWPTYGRFSGRRTRRHF